MLAALAVVASFSFSDVQAWKWSDGRNEQIPAFAGSISNRSGEDWAEARFAVTSQCNSGGTSRYEVTLRDVLLGSHRYEGTAFDAIGKVAACEGPVSVEFLGGKPYEESKRPSYVIVGFSYEHKDGPLSMDLAGILDFRHRSDTQNETKRVYWKDGGAQAVDGRPGYYMFRVEPGTLGLAGFLLDEGENSTGPLARFIRYFAVPPGLIAFIGRFDVSEGPGLLVSVTIDPAEDVLRALPAIDDRIVVRAKPVNRGASSLLSPSR